MLSGEDRTCDGLCDLISLLLISSGSLIRSSKGRVPSFFSGVIAVICELKIVYANESAVICVSFVFTKVK